MDKRKKYKQQAIIQFVMLLAILILVNFVSSFVFDRIDLTKEKRFSLSPSTKTLLKELDDIVYIRVYLKLKDPPGFRRLQNSAKEMLDEFRYYAKGNVEYEFIDPLKNKNQNEQRDILIEMQRSGLKPTRLTVSGSDGVSEKYIIPGAMISYKGRELALDLLQTQVGMREQQILNNSIGKLEYAFANTIQKLQHSTKKKIGLMKGHGELSEANISDIGAELSSYFNIEWIDLPKTTHIPKIFKAVIIAKPTKPFSRQDKFKIDQYIMNGGKILWVLDMMSATMDSMQNKTAFMSTAYDLNLQDMLFNYGVRVNKSLVQDLQCIEIPINVGSIGDVPQFEPKYWFYFPVIISTSDHPVAKNLDAILCKFAGSIDIVGRPNLKKTVLLHTSENTKELFNPVRINLTLLQFEPKVEDYNKPHRNIAVLVEGEFQSHFKGRLDQERIKILKDSLGMNILDKCEEANKMIFISDGDIIKNEVSRDGIAEPLGYYRYTNQVFANKEFIVNAIEYLTDNSGIIETRSKEVKLRLLDITKVKKGKLKWQLINIFIPIIFVFLTGFIFNFIRFRRYTF